MTNTFTVVENSQTTMIALAILALLQVADVLTTHRALGRGLREANPVMRWLIARLGFWPAAAVKAAASMGAGYAIHIYDPRWVWLPVVLMVAVVAWNIRALARRR